jgi:hypothetical protein
MARLTDEELEQLLRETFADKEELVDTLPQATKHRRPVAPVLLAAAAVLVVLGSILYGVNRGRDVDPAPPVATTQSGDDAEIWASAITAITQRFQPEYKLDVVSVTDATSVAVRSTGSPESSPQSAGTAHPFSVAEKDQIAAQVGKATRLQFKWADAEPHAEIAKCFPTLARVSVGNVVDKGDHKEVPTRISYNCGFEYLLTYRVEKQGDAWAVTGTVGPSEGVIPVWRCVFSGKTPATPRPGC